MARQQHRFRGSSRTSRLTTWLGPADAGYVNVASGGKSLLASSSFEEPNTVIRTRGVVSVGPQSFGVDVEIKGAYGVAIVSTDALAVGITAIPGPFSDSDWGGWLVWRSFAFIFEFGDSTGRMFANVNMEIDSKAMRKVESNESLVVIAESQGGLFQIWDGTRHLIKLT